MNAFGCRAYDSMIIFAHPCCDIYMSTAFTPNGDGNNDYFFPLLRPYQQIVSFKIFDRYGKLVYDNDNPQKGWNGNYPNGDKAPTDTYMYMIKYTCTDGQVYTDKNDVTLVR
jgi:gliding motility-associated-like protein